jgi:hypothetical protein
VGTGWRRRHFLTLPPPVAEELRDEVPSTGPGFGSINVSVTLGRSSWDTSVFPDKATGSFLLPVKKEVRRANQLIAGDEVDVTLRIRQPAQDESGTARSSPQRWRNGSGT